MQTDDLIRALGRDARSAAPRQTAVLALAAVAAALAAAVLFFLLIGPRPDIAEAARTPRFLFKFVVTLVLAIAALRAVGALSRPGQRPAAWTLALAPALLALAVGAEFLAVPRAAWPARWIGSNIAVCLTFIPLIGLLPLALFLAALRHGAPTRPGLSGAVAGVLAGAVAATFYAAHCTDDSPFFVATWYTLAIAGLALVGWLGGRAVLRW